MYKVIINRPNPEDLTENGYNRSITINPAITAEALISYGFTNNNPPMLYFCRDLGNDISFNLRVWKDTLKIEGIDVLDEDFLQPYDYQAILWDNKNSEFAKGIYYKVNDTLTKLQEDGIITGFEIGMYI